MAHDFSNERKHEISSSWQTVTDTNVEKIRREFTFDDFTEAISFVNSIMGVIVELDHHPDIHIYNNRVVIETWTHNTSKITENDYELARKIDSLFVLNL